MNLSTLIFKLFHPKYTNINFWKFLRDILVLVLKIFHIFTKKYNFLSQSNISSHMNINDKKLNKNYEYISKRYFLFFNEIIFKNQGKTHLKSPHVDMTELHMSDSMLHGNVLPSLLGLLLIEPSFHSHFLLYLLLKSFRLW